jgi:hypothetical protein
MTENKEPHTFDELERINWSEMAEAFKKCSENMRTVAESFKIAYESMVKMEEMPHLMNWMSDQPVMENENIDKASKLPKKLRKGWK